jgi:hypothetical protein
MKKLVFIISVAFLACSCRDKGASMQLRLKYKKGDAFNITYHVNAATEENPQIVNEATRVMFKVDSVMRNEYLLSCKVDYIRAKNTGEMAIQSEEYYSEKSEDKMSASEKEMHAAFKPMLDSTLLLRINDRGEITKGFTYRNGSPIAGLEGPIDMKNCLVPLPEKPVTIDEDWRVNDDIPLTGGKKKTTFRINGINAGVMNVVSTGQLQVMKGTGMKSNVTGDYLLDADTKQLLSAKIETDAKFMFDKGKITLTITVE